MQSGKSYKAQSVAHATLATGPRTQRTALPGTQRCTQTIGGCKQGGRTAAAAVVVAAAAAAAASTATRKLKFVNAVPTAAWLKVANKPLLDTSALLSVAVEYFVALWIRSNCAGAGAERQVIRDVLPYV